jgi:hypothetical protein
MGWQQQNIFANQVVIYGTNGGEFIYSGTPAAGNLIESHVAVATTDPYGNAVLAGSTVYGKAGGIPVAINTFNGAVNFYTATTEAGPWTSVGSEAFTAAGALTLLANATLTLTGGGSQLHETFLSLASAGRATIQNGDDGELYNLGKLVMDNGAAGDTTISSTTPTVIGQTNVSAARYLFTMNTIVTPGATGPLAVAIGLVASSGATINYCRIQFKTFIDANSSQSVIATLSQNTLTRYTTPATLATGSSYIIEAAGLISFSATGTVQFQAAEGTSGDSWTLVHPSYATLEPIT